MSRHAFEEFLAKDLQLDLQELRERVYVFECDCEGQWCHGWRWAPLPEWLLRAA